MCVTQSISEAFLTDNPHTHTCRYELRSFFLFSRKSRSMLLKVFFPGSLRIEVRFSNWCGKTYEATHVYPFRQSPKHTRKHTPAQHTPAQHTPAQHTHLFRDPHVEVVEIGVAAVGFPAVLAAVLAAAEHGDGVECVGLTVVVTHP